MKIPYYGLFFNSNKNWQTPGFAGVFDARPAAQLMNSLLLDSCALQFLEIFLPKKRLEKIWAYFLARLAPDIIVRKIHSSFFRYNFFTVYTNHLPCFPVFATRPILVST
jgi:hypothetical protein